MAEREMENVELDLPAAVWKTLSDMALDEGITMDEMVEKVLRQYLDSYGEQPQEEHWAG